MGSIYKCSACQLAASHASRYDANKAGWWMIEIVGPDVVKYFVYCPACSGAAWLRAAIGATTAKKEKK